MTFYLSKNTADFIKISAAVMVMMHHYSQYVCANNLSDSIIYRSLSSQAGYLGVAIFFFLSGFGLMESEQRSHLRLKEYFKKRFFKIYFPVLAVTFVWILASPFLLPQSSFNGAMAVCQIVEGKTIIINNILVDFGDGVLWFIKVLIGLYACFYVYSILRQKNQFVSAIFLICIAIVATLAISYIMGDYMAISVPFFFIGIILSLDKEKKGVMISIILLLLIAVIEFVAWDNFSLSIHNLIDVVAIAALIIACTIREIEIRLPSVIAAIYFDIYLIHNKVLMPLKANSDIVEVFPFLLLSIIATIGFHFFRTKLLRI